VKITTKLAKNSPVTFVTQALSRPLLPAVPVVSRNECNGDNGENGEKLPASGALN